MPREAEAAQSERDFVAGGAIRRLRTAAEWIAREIVANEVHGFGPLPASARVEIARAMVEDEFLGWPDMETAQATLDEFEWANG